MDVKIDIDTRFGTFHLAFLEYMIDMGKLSEKGGLERRRGTEVRKNEKKGYGREAFDHIQFASTGA